MQAIDFLGISDTQEKKEKKNYKKFTKTYSCFWKQNL